MADPLQVILQAIDKATPVIQNVAEETSKAAGFLEKHWKAVTAAGAAFGVGLEALARKQAPLIEKTNRLAASLGMTSEEVREMAKEVSNVTFSLEDTLAVMEAGRAQGIKSAEQLKEYGRFWDTVSSATGEAVTQLAESSSGLRAVGIAAGEEKEALAAFGFIAQETTGSINEFLMFLNRSGPEIRKMGMNINDTAAFLGALEHELGMTSRVARQEFEMAVNQVSKEIEDANKLIQESQQELIELREACLKGEVSWEEYLEKLPQLKENISSGNEVLARNQDVLMAVAERLGLTRDQLSKYMDLVGESSDVMDRNAKINEESFTVMQRLQHWISEVTYQYGDLIHVVSSATPVLIALGPAIKAVTLAKTTLAKVAIPAVITGFRAMSATIMGIPVFGWIVAAITAVIAIGVALWQNWDTVKEKAVQIWGAVSEFFTGLWERIKAVFWNAIEWAQQLFLDFHPVGLIIKHWETISGFFKNLWDDVKNIFKSAWEGLVDIVKKPVNTILGFINTLIGGMESMVNGIAGAINAIPSFTIPDWLPSWAGGGKSFGLPNIPTVSLPRVPLMDTGGLVKGPGLFAVGPGVKEIIREPSPSIGNINIYASTREGGREAARGFVEELHRRGLRLSGVY